MNNRQEREIQSFERVRELLQSEFGYKNISYKLNEDFGLDVMADNTKIEVKSCETTILDNPWFSTTSGYFKSIRYKENDPSTGYTLDSLENTPYSIENPYLRWNSSSTYHYGFPVEVSGHTAVVLNLDCIESPVINCKFSKCVRNKIAVIFEFKDAWVLFRWSDLESARLCNLEMWVKSGHTKCFNKRIPCWERKVFLDVSKAKIIRK